MTAILSKVLFVGFFMGFSIHGLRNLEHNGALNTLAVKVAAHLVGAGQRTGGVVGVGSAAAAAEQLGKTIMTFLACVDIAQLEFIAQLFILNAVEYIAQLKRFITDKLMAGVQIPPRV